VVLPPLAYNAETSDARYIGVADWWGRHVWVERRGVRRALRHRGTDRLLVPFAWGRSGVGALELSRALLFDATGSVALGERFCRDFTHAIVAHLPEPEFALDRDEILSWLADQP
jgi:uncharacterized protein DUF6166